MQLPAPLQTAIDILAESLGLHELIEAREELTKRYRSPPKNTPFITTEIQRQSYIISRMPATYAAVHKALSTSLQTVPLQIKSLLDLGAGPGTAMWASCTLLPDITSVTLIEKDNALSSIGKQLSQQSTSNAIQNAIWEHQDLETITALPPNDLILLSYSFGELQSNKLQQLLEICWKATKQLLLIVEPGTPAGFEKIRMARNSLLALGGHVIAPCPHMNECPMKGGDWCHFAARVERTSLHRRLKGGSLGFEDEKFSYIAVARHPYPAASARILSPPDRHSGHISLKLCTPEGIQQPIISKKMGPLYKRARKAEWGDAL